MNRLEFAETLRFVDVPIDADLVGLVASRRRDEPESAPGARRSAAIGRENEQAIRAASREHCRLDVLHEVIESCELFFVSP